MTTAPIDTIINKTEYENAKIMALSVNQTRLFRLFLLIHPRKG